MELKGQITLDNEKEAKSFNRTIMELKVTCVVDIVTVPLCFNRTIMELKDNRRKTNYFR